MSSFSRWRRFVVVVSGGNAGGVAMVVVEAVVAVEAIDVCWSRVVTFV